MELLQWDAPGGWMVRSSEGMHRKVVEIGQLESQTVEVVALGDDEPPQCCSLFDEQAIPVYL